MSALLSEGFVQAAIDSKEQFPIDFDDVWKGLGYSRKDNAKRALIRELIENEDFLIDEERSTTAVSGVGIGYVNENIKLTVDGYKHFALMARTKEGRAARTYFIEVDKKYRQHLTNLLNVSITEPIAQPQKDVSKLESKLEKSKAQNFELRKTLAKLKLDITSIPKPFSQ